MDKDPSPRRIVLIGDTIIDVNTYGRVLGVSAETPTLVMQMESEMTTKGGAAFVAENLRALGIYPTFITNTCRADCATKHRFWAGGYKLLQVDRLPPEAEYTLSDTLICLNPALDPSDVVIFSDYRHGFLAEVFVRWAVNYCAGRGAITMVDSQVSQQPSNHHWYRGVDYIFVNEREYELVRLQQRAFPNIVIKQGSRGAHLIQHITDGITSENDEAGIPVTAVDTCGAGDAFLAAFAAFHHLGDAEALRRANMWAAASVTLQGTQVPNYADIFGVR